MNQESLQIETQELMFWHDERGLHFHRNYQFKNKLTILFIIGFMLFFMCGIIGFLLISRHISTESNPPFIFTIFSLLISIIMLLVPLFTIRMLFGELFSYQARFSPNKFQVWNFMNNKVVHFENEKFILTLGLFSTRTGYHIECKIDATNAEKECSFATIRLNDFPYDLSRNRCMIQRIQRLADSTGYFENVEASFDVNVISKD